MSSLLSTESDAPAAPPTPPPPPATPATGRREIKRRLLLRAGLLAEWLVILAVGWAFGTTLLDFDPRTLQQSGEHNESATLPILAATSVVRHGEIPLWNPFMLNGFPHAGDFINHFWNPVATLPVLIWGGIVGMKLSIFLSFLIAGYGQWYFGQVMGLRGMFRLWAALLFMLSGGVALLWRLGWYELLLGIAWFPWCYALIWRAVDRGTGTSIALASVAIAMVMTTGGGYYPFYLAGSAGVFVAVQILYARPSERWGRLRRLVAIGALGLALSAVTVVPWIDGWRYTAREAAPDLEQVRSQPLPYALFNYVVSTPEWFNSSVLGPVGGVTWFYIGALPLLAAFSLAPLALRRRPRRRYLVTLIALTVFILAWHANRYTPMRYVYDLVPFLYTFRFNGRLLMVATCPLLVVGALGMQHLYLVLRRPLRHYRVSIGFDTAPRQSRQVEVTPVVVLTLTVGVLLATSARDVFTVNRGFAFLQDRILPQAQENLTWLHEFDPTLYYTNVGGGSISWKWTPDAYLLEMPLINFFYNRELRTYNALRQAPNRFKATAKYQIAGNDQAHAPNAQLVRPLDGGGIWLNPDALPYAFTASAALLNSNAPLVAGQVTAQPARLDGPNRIIVQATADALAPLVVLMSDYPGWQLYVDGVRTPPAPINSYLGANALAGQHTYTFVFHPIQHDIGLTVTLLALLAALWLSLADRWPRLRLPIERLTWLQRWRPDRLLQQLRP